MKVKFSVVANTLEEAEKRAKAEVLKFTDQPGEPTTLWAEADEVVTSRDLNGEVSSSILSWEVFFECDV